MPILFRPQTRAPLILKGHKAHSQPPFCWRICWRRNLGKPEALMDPHISQIAQAPRGSSLRKTLAFLRLFALIADDPPRQGWVTPPTLSQGAAFVKAVVRVRSVPTTNRWRLRRPSSLPSGAPCWVQSPHVKSVTPVGAPRALEGGPLPALPFGSLLHSGRGRRLAEGLRTPAGDHRGGPRQKPRRSFDLRGPSPSPHRIRAGIHDETELP